MPNEPLKLRAGKNFLPFLNAFQQVSQKLRKLTVKDFVLLENTSGQRLVVAGSIGAACSVFNRSTDPLDIQMHLEDADGNRALMDSETVVAGTVGTLTPLVGMLAQGEKLVLVITSGASILTGSGVWVLGGATIPPAPGGICLRDVVENTTMSVDLPPGMAAISGGIGYSISNFSAVVGITVDVYAVTDEGEFIFQSAVGLGANSVTSLAPVLAPGVTARLQFSALPGVGYLQLNRDFVLPTNAFDAESFPG